MKSIYKRLIIIFLPLLLILVISVYLIYSSFNSLRNELIQKSSLILVKSVEEGISEMVGKSPELLTRGEINRVRKFFSDLATSEGNILSILVIDTLQRIVVSSDPRVEGNTYYDAEQVQWLRSDKLQFRRGIWDTGFEVFDIISPLKSKDDKTIAYLRVVLSLSEIEKPFEDLSIILIPIFIVFGFLLIFSLFFIAKVYTKPLDSLKQAISKINEEDFSYRVKYKHQDEFTDTFVKLNRTIEKVGSLKEGYKKAEKRILSLLQAVNESILIMDPVKYVTSYNDATLKLFKANHENFNDWFIKILDTNLDLNSTISNVMQKGILITDKQMTVFLPDDTEIFVKMSIQPLREEEHISGAVLTFKDVRLINELENNLLRSMKFGVIANLASSISHEIKNPLSALALHAEVLNIRIGKLDFEGKEQVINSLKTLQDEVKRLNRIIQQFLSLARPTNLELNLIDMNTIIREVLNLVQQQAQEQKLTIHADLAKSLQKIYGDEDQLKQVLLNIILNAFAAMGTGGKLDIQSRIENRKILIDIKDTGKGMPREIQEKVFDLYFTTKRDGGGIGLAVCKNIMEAHEGQIYFKSTPDKGTVFTIQLPVKDPTTISKTQTRIRKVSYSDKK